MASVGDHIRIKDFQAMTNVSGDVLNVYFFEIVAMTASKPLSLMGDELGEFWYEEFLTPILGIQTVSVAHTRLEIDNMENFLTDSVIVVPDSPVLGSVGDNYAASSTAASFQLVRQNRTTRHGSKRIAGVPDTAVTNNVVVAGGEPTFIAAGEQMAAGFTFDIGVGETMSIVPVIAKTPVAPATLPTAYNNVIEGLFRGIGSQTSRKQLLS